MTPEQRATLLAKLSGAREIVSGVISKVAEGSEGDSSNIRRSEGDGQLQQSGVPVESRVVVQQNGPSAPLSNGEQILSRIAELAESLAKAAPGYERLLQVIHTALGKDDTLVHLLSEEQVGVIVAGLSRKKNIVIATAASKSSSKNKQLSKLTADDL